MAARPPVLAVLCASVLGLALPGQADGAIAFRAASSANTANNAVATLAIPRPVGLAVGDVMVATIAIRVTTNTVSATGWTAVSGLDTTAGTLIRQATFFKVATAADTTAASFTFNLGASTARGAGGIVAYSGVDTAAPVDVTAATASAVTGTTATAPAVTTTNINARVVHAVSWASTGAVTPAAGTTERYENASTNATATNNATVQAADLAQVAAGSTGTRTVTSAANARWIAQTVALNELPELTASFPTAYSWPSLVPGTAATSAEQSVSVTSNRSWGVRVMSDQSTGRSTQWTGTAYGSLMLANPMQWRTSSIGGSAQSTSFANLSGSAQPAVTGRGASSGPVAVGVSYRQSVSYADQPVLPTGHTYRQVVSYAAQQGF